MDPLRMIKDAGELTLMAESQRVAGIGMDRARELLRPGVTAHEIATEVTYALMRAGAERTSTPIYVTFGIQTCMLHGRLSPNPLRRGDLAVVDLTPQLQGYCSNLARTFVVGEPDEQQGALLDAYAELIPAVRDALRPGATVGTLDGVVGAILERRDLAAHHVHGIGHGLGLRFEETPASTIIPPHRNVPLRDGMVMTIGHTVLAIPGFGGVRHEDAYRVTPWVAWRSARTPSTRSCPPRSPLSPRRRPRRQWLAIRSASERPVGGFPAASERRSRRDIAPWV